MGVDQRGFTCADDLASDIGPVSDGLVARIMKVVRATDPLADDVERPVSTSIRNRTREGGSLSTMSLVEPSVLQVDREIECYLQMAHGGDAQAARRLAELLELAHNEEEATVWWRRAAKLGDADAAAYVKYILDRE